jgi:phenylacetate-CoA ligase
MRKTPLDQWISRKIGNDPDEELTLEDIQRYQLEKLRSTIDYVSEKSSFYRRHLGGLSGRTLRHLDDFSAFPFTTIADLQDYGPQFLCVSQSLVERVVTLQAPDISSKPRRISFTAADQELTIDFFHHGMTTFVEPGQKVLILMPGETPGSVGDLLAHGLSRADVHGIVHGIVVDPARTIREIIDREVDCLVGIPTQVLALARHGAAEEIPGGLIKSVLLSADYVPGSIVSELRRLWGCEVFTHYGTTEMCFGGGVECEAHAGYHLREADLYFEIVDPISGRPQVSGELGEIVFTTLTRTGMPLVRYRTGDISRFLPDACPCGTVLKRMDRVSGRVHEMALLRSGDWLGIADIDEALFAITDVVNYSATLTRTREIDRLEIAVFLGSQGNRPVFDGIVGSLLRVPAVDRAVRGGHLVVDPIRNVQENWVTSGVVKRAILQRTQEEVIQ